MLQPQPDPPQKPSFPQSNNFVPSTKLFHWNIYKSKLNAPEQPSENKFNHVSTNNQPLNWNKFQQIYNMKQNTSNEKKPTNKLPIGQVKIIKLTQPIPQGWRILTLSQGTKYKKYLLPLLQCWSIVAFDSGKLDGYGYGNEIHQSYGNECGEMFIIEPYACPIQQIGGNDFDYVQ